MIITIEEHLLQGHVSVERNDNGISPWRLWHDDILLFHDESYMAKAHEAAGVRIRFQTDAKAVRLSFVSTKGEIPFDLVCEEKILRHVKAIGASGIADFDLNGEADVYEIWLPPAQSIVLKTLELMDATKFGTPHDERLKWITYGSSITQCSAASSPALTWPAIAARENDLHLTCLGYGGQCHIDPIMGEVIGSLAADLITLKLGINVYGQSSLNLRSYRPSVLNLIRTIRRLHPTVPIGVITPIFSGPRESTASSSGMTLENFREENREVVNILKESGDHDLHLYEGHDVFGSDRADYLPDDLHPNGLGYQLMGESVSEIIVQDMLAKIK
jgi:hypothetical protein